jgi:hypothetical protein
MEYFETGSVQRNKREPSSLLLELHKLNLSLDYPTSSRGLFNKDLKLFRNSAIHRLAHQFCIRFWLGGMPVLLAICAQLACPPE